MFVPTRRYIRTAESAVAVYRNQIGVGPDLRLNIGIDLANIAAVAHVLTSGADRDHAVSDSDAGSGESTQGDGPVAGSVVGQRRVAEGSVEDPLSVARECPNPDGDVGCAGGVGH